MDSTDQKMQPTSPCEGETSPADKQPSDSPAAKAPEMPPANSGSKWGIKRAFASALCRYSKFEGRASRAEYWYLALGNFIIIMCINVLMTILTYTCAEAYGYTGAVYAQHFSNLLVFVYSGFMLMPGLSLCVRRLQDSGKDWKWLLLALIPVVGLPAVVYFLCLPSGPANQYGEGPADPAGDDEKMPPFVASVVAKVVAYVGVVCRAPGKWAGILGGGFALVIGLILLTGQFVEKSAPTFTLDYSGSSSSSLFGGSESDLDEAVEMLQRCEIINPFDVGEMKKSFYTNKEYHDNVKGESSRDFMYHYKLFKDGHRKLSEHDYVFDIYNCWRKDRKKHLPLEAVKVFIEEGSALNGNMNNVYALDLAAEAGHTEIVELMLEEGADASLGTPLVFAADAGQVETVKVLLQAKGINVNAVTSNGDYAINAAVLKGHIEVVKLLLAAPGIKVPSEVLHSAVMKQRPEILKLLLAVPNVKINESYRIYQTDYSILETAVHPHFGNGNLEIIKLLLSMPNLDVNGGSPHPIETAQRNNQHEVVNLLLAHPGIKIPAKFLYEVIRSNNMDCLKTVLAVPGFDVNEDCPLGVAICTNNIEITKLLLNIPGIDVNKALSTRIFKIGEELFYNPGTKVDNESPLAKAVRLGYPELVKLLMEAPGIDVNKGYPLAIAVRNGSQEIVKLLTAAPDIKVPTALLREAVKAGNVEIVKSLLTVPGIDINGTQQENQGDPVLMCELNAKNREVNIEIVKMLLAVPGIDVNKPQISETDYHPVTEIETYPLYKAVKLGRTDILQLLLEVPGINVFQGYESGRDALSIASSPESLKLLQEAIDKLPPNATKYTEVYHYMKLVRPFGEGLSQLARCINESVNSYNVEQYDGKLGTDAQALIAQEQQNQKFSFTHVDDIESFINDKDKEVFRWIENDKRVVENFIARHGRKLSKNTHSILTQLYSGTADAVQSQSADSQESPHQDAEDNAQQPAQSADSTGSDDRSSLDPLIQRMRDLRCRQSDSKLYQKRLLTLLPKIREGADVNLTLPETKGNTALHYACAIGSLSITQWLLEHGANPNAVTDKGKTPLQCVGSDNRAAIIKLLKEYQAR